MGSCATYGRVTMLFALASLGLPGLGNFVGEFLVLFGAYRVNIPLTVLATVGIVFATVYSLWIIQRAFHGPLREYPKLHDLSPREVGIMALMIAAIVGLGLAPQPVLNTTQTVSGKRDSERKGSAPEQSRGSGIAGFVWSGRCSLNSQI